MATKPVPFPGFTPITDRVYLRNDERVKPVPADEPTTIVILGWGDGMPKHVSKYSDGFHELFPSSRIIVVLSSTMQASNQQLEARVEAMKPVIDLVFPTPTGDGTDEERVLFHAMSNTGGIFLAAVAVAYQRRHGTDKTLPHPLLVCDSTPGGLNFASQVGRWSRAMAVGTAKFFPWPFIVTHALWYTFLWANWAWERLRGLEPSGNWATRILNDHGIASTDSTRLYLYSKEDQIIWWEDLEANAAEVKRLGYPVEMELFEGSLHVGHGRMHPDQYWTKISNCWKATQSK
ncbi:hypothetical protein N7495_004983 [Penicillium taxi]|uniref:uncharacterized protein n=1 Tax=Penicillium taxi TaxID=168475 RepID=UPI002544DD29|nr:uncharacterized protein N7495_004983 [Penicillium taxi]KAJ5893292.1 hypothetical protein N7495_004983 [Penicillium taxi]